MATVLGEVQNTTVNQLLFLLPVADMQSTSDQQFTKIFTGTNYVITSVIAIQASGGTSVACAGGIYTAASKAGSALIAVGQSWVALTGTGKIVIATLGAPILADVQTAIPYLSLTTGSTAAATASLYIYGVCLS